MREPTAGWLTMADEEDASDEIEFDPRWEVQPAPDVDDDTGDGRPWTFIIAVAIVLVVAVALWLMMGTSPAV